MQNVDKINIEIKAHCESPEKVRQILDSLGARYQGLDHQVDTYFNCEDGRLKLRSGSIENSLIFYKRGNQKGPKESDIALSKLQGNEGVGAVLEKAYGIKVIVDKQRHIYFIENVKFHVDSVKGLGAFVEIEAINDIGDGSEMIGKEKLLEQCGHYMEALQVKEEGLIDRSYSDMILEKGN